MNRTQRLALLALVCATIATGLTIWSEIRRQKFHREILEGIDRIIREHTPPDLQQHIHDHHPLSNP